MAASKRQLGALIGTSVFVFALVSALGVLGLGGCTDGRTPPKLPLKLQSQIPPQSYLIARNDIQYSGQQTNILALAKRRGILYVTGFPNFGFAGWDISSNPEVPRLLFAAGTQIDTFTQGRPWTVDAYGSGSIGLMGNYAFTSGLAGMTVIDISDATTPRVVGYYPEPNYDTGEINQDLAYADYKAIIPHPTR